MIWVNSPESFCSASETVTKISKGYALDPSSSFSIYPPTYGKYKTAEAPTGYPRCLHYVEVYMEDLLCASQGDPTQQHRSSKLAIRDLE